MWPFRRRRPKPHEHLRRIIAGFVIGAAISSIIGKKLLEGEEEDQKREDEEGENTK
jgi:hypothetical protein